MDMVHGGQHRERLGVGSIIGADAEGFIGEDAIARRGAFDVGIGGFARQNAQMVGADAICDQDLPRASPIASAPTAPK